MTRQQLNYHRIESVINYMSENFKSRPSLKTIAESAHISPFHFHRIFTDWVGISPKKFMSYLTMEYLRNKIQETDNFIEAAELAGLSSQSRVHDLFINVEGVSPQQYKTSGKGLTIHYGYHPSPFGICFIAVSERGICALTFIDKDKTESEFNLFSEKWQNAKLIHNKELTQSYIYKIFKPQYKGNEKLDVYLKGTPFQIKVWEALLNIPYGGISSYKQVANIIGQPEAVRAVGAAVKANPILFLIPCHRVIFKNGELGNYHKGKVRKQAMIVWETINS